MNKLYKRIAYDFNEFDFQYQYNISLEQILLYISFSA